MTTGYETWTTVMYVRMCMPSGVGLHTSLRILYTQRELITEVWNISTCWSLSYLEKTKDYNFFAISASVFPMKS